MDTEEETRNLLETIQEESNNPHQKFDDYHKGYDLEFDTAEKNKNKDPWNLGYSTSEKVYKDKELLIYSLRDS